MDLYARVNILDGRAVRLPHGNIADAIALDADPVHRARHWCEQGADFIHIVDLDAAAYGDYKNRPLLDQIISEVDAPIQIAGGIRSEAEGARLLEIGAWRIVLGTAAIQNQHMVWELCREFPGKIVVALDVRPDEEVAIEGWTKNSGRYLEEVLIEMSSAGVASFLVAEAGRDALTEPPDFRVLKEALATVTEPIIAAGGVRDLDDLRKVLSLNMNGRRLGGVIVGREVTAGRFTIDEAKKVIGEGAVIAEETIPTEPQVAPSLAHAVNEFQTLAEDLERAAAHARTAAERFSDGDAEGGLAQGFSVTGHIRNAQEILNEIARRHSDFVGRRR